MARKDDFTPEPGEQVRLEDTPTDEPLGSDSDDDARASLRRDAERLRQGQDRLMAHGTYGVLLLLQGMDASGKDETITYALSSLDMRGCEFKQFRKMDGKEAKHDFLWRAAAAMPARGQIGIFARSYYEHVVGERLHPESLDDQKLPPEARDDIWAARCRQISDYERYLYENGIHVIKVFLHVSKEEQRKRLLKRIESPETRWQFSEADITERERWDEYMTAYGEALTLTNTEVAPWHVLPADREWCARAAVAELLAEKLESLHDGYPELSEEQAKVLEDARRRLEADAPEKKR